MEIIITLILATFLYSVLPLYLTYSHLDSFITSLSDILVMIMCMVMMTLMMMTMIMMIMVVIVLMMLKIMMIMIR